MIAKKFAAQLEANNCLLAPSLFCADPLALAQAVESVRSEADWLHIDVMDGHFVPNLALGPAHVGALRRSYPNAFLDVHLMVRSPERFIGMFLAHSPNVLAVHAEATPHIHRLLQEIRQNGCGAGLCLNPGTPVSLVEPVLHLVDLVLVMSVNPGFGGQRFIPETLSKVTDLCRWRSVHGADFLIEMDGGLGPDNVRTVVTSGCDVVVAGSAVFGSPDPALTLRRMKELANPATEG